MTYGEHSGAIRRELAGLLGHHRVQQRLGGKGLHTVPESTTPQERQHLGRVIRRYRYAVLVWCSQALRATSDKTVAPRGRSARTPTEELSCVLSESLSAGPGPMRLLDLLGVEHGFELVTRWQRAAQAAALGEHDFGAGVNRGQLSYEQIATVHLDVAQVVEALTVLDTRYALIPGWQPLRGHDRLARAAAEVAASLAGSRADLGVDHLGYRPRAGRIPRGEDRGLATALIAQHNLILELADLPTALNLRRVISLQALASAEAARRANRAAPRLAASFAERAAIYRHLLADSRNLAGELGSGGAAVVEGHAVVTALRAPGGDQAEAAEQLAALRRLFLATDARAAALIERGLADRCYVVSVNVPRISDKRIGGVAQPRLRYMPADTQPNVALLPLVRERLRPSPRVAPSRTSRSDRSELAQVLSLQPPSMPRPRT